MSDQDDGDDAEPVVDGQLVDTPIVSDVIRSYQLEAIFGGERDNKEHEP